MRRASRLWKASAGTQLVPLHRILLPLTRKRNSPGSALLVRFGPLQHERADAERRAFRQHRVADAELHRGVVKGSLVGWCASNWRISIPGGPPEPRVRDVEGHGAGAVAHASGYIESAVAAAPGHVHCEIE